VPARPGGSLPRRKRADTPGPSSRGGGGIRGGAGWEEGEAYSTKPTPASTAAAAAAARARAVRRRAEAWDAAAGLLVAKLSLDEVDGPARGVR